MQRTDYAIWGWIAGAVVACSSNGSVDIGDDNAESTAPAWAQGLGGTYSTDPIRGSVDPSVLQAGTVPPGCEQRQEPFNPTITYRGYIQNFPPNSLGWPSEVVILEFTELTTSAVSGRLLSDQAGAGIYAMPKTDCAALPCTQGAEGFQYTLTQGSFDGQRLRFTVNLNESMCAWCGQLTPYESGNGQYMCAPDGAMQLGLGSTGCAACPRGTTEWQEWDCRTLLACRQARLCVCSADGCTAATSGPSFDLVVSGDQLNGPTDLGNVILTRETS